MPTPPVDPARLRSVHLIGCSEDFGRYWKTICYDPHTAGLRPNRTFVTRAGSIIFETNEVGLTGAPLDNSRKLVVVWGDSVVFCAGRSWSRLLDDYAPGYQFLSGGVDGDPYSNVLRRASEFNASRGVALNLLMLGWHPFTPSWWKGTARGNGNASVADDLRQFLRRNPNTVVLTMPTALNPAILAEPMSAYLVEGHPDIAFRFFGDWSREVQGQQEAYAYICERNAIARDVCREMDIRVVDLFASLDTSGKADFRENFIDVIHLRAPAHPLIAQLVYEGIKDLLIRAG